MAAACGVFRTLMPFPKSKDMASWTTEKPQECGGIMHQDSLEGPLNLGFYLAAKRDCTTRSVELPEGRGAHLA
jgi:hypothetical protein